MKRLKETVSVILRPIRLCIFKIRWRRNNIHNETKAINRFHLNNVSVGKGTYGPIQVLYDAGIAHLTIGHYCSIADSVKFFLGGGHDYKRISTYPFQTKVYKSINAKNRDRSLDIEIDDDVWIGYDTIILGGARIGKGCVIGARSVVTGTIPPYSIYVGNKVIKKRFSDNIINKLLGIDFSTIIHSANDSYQSFCTEVITEDNIDRILKYFCESQDNYK